MYITILNFEIFNICYIPALKHFIFGFPGGNLHDEAFGMSLGSN